MKMSETMRKTLQGAIAAAFERTPLQCAARGCKGCAVCNPHAEAPVPKDDPSPKESEGEGVSSGRSVRTYYVCFIPGRLLGAADNRFTVTQRKPETASFLRVRASCKAEAESIAKERGW